MIVLIYATNYENTKRYRSATSAHALYTAEHCEPDLPREFKQNAKDIAHTYI